MALNARVGQERNAPGGEEGEEVGPHERQGVEGHGGQEARGHKPQHEEQHLSDDSVQSRVWMAACGWLRCEVTREGGHTFSAT